MPAMVFPAGASSSTSSSAASSTVSSLSLRPGDFTFLTIRFMSDFFPSYLFTALSSFSWVCWIAPNNVKVNQMFGTTHGLGMGLLTFDWGRIAFNGSPLVVPFWAAANIGISIVFFYWILVPLLYVGAISSFIPFLFSEHTHAVHQRMVQRLPAHIVLAVIR
jgi:hypothetical protein